MNHEDFSRYLFDKYETYHASSFRERHFTPDTLYKALQRLTTNSNKLLELTQAGESFEKRPIYHITAGTGQTKVFLWSQMHGDESTATMAICDILKYLITTKNEPATLKILSSLTLHFLPMLNPDGAQRIQRRTAQGIDMNRDALALRTPEAVLLKQLQGELQPEFGFNLHDQELSTVNTTKELAALALLAPAFDAEKSMNDVRKRAKHVAGYIAGTLKKFVPHNLTRYDDGFEPRAFGDNIQKWGTTTVLIESGHAINDPQKNFIRKLNTVALLSSFYAIATGDYLHSQIDDYERLPPNGKKVFDVIVRNAIIEQRDQFKTSVDLGISYQQDTHTTETPVLWDIGDLQTFIGLQEVDGRRTIIPLSACEIGKEFQWQKYFQV
ncbi:MAG: M14 family zinc carboxypeptidase [Bacteroidota bacterium]